MSADDTWWRMFANAVCDNDEQIRRLGIAFVSVENVERENVFSLSKSFIEVMYVEIVYCG